MQKLRRFPVNGFFFESMEERDAVTKAGRSIYGEPNNSGHGFTIRYYYNASENFGKILEVNQIRNDMESFAYMVGQLEYYAGQMSASRADKKNYALGYIRTINKNYNSLRFSGDTRELAFEAVCGDYNASFNDSIDKDLSHGLNFPTYFGSFVATSDLNYKAHSQADFPYHGYSLMDPQNSSRTIDLTHFATVIDGVYADTGGVPFDRETFKDLISWAGDLQDAVGKYENRIDDFSAMLAKTGADSYCSYEDFVADIDGLEIGQKLKYSTTIEQAIRVYYNAMAEEGNDYRYTSFIRNLGYEYYHHYNYAVRGFEKRVFEFLGLNLNDNGYVSDCNTLGYKYYLLRRTRGLPSKKYRYRVGKSVVDYVLEKAHKQEEIVLNENQVF